MKIIIHGLVLIAVFAIVMMPAHAVQAQFCAPPSPPPAPPPPPPPPCKCKPKKCNKCTASPAYAATGIYETEAMDIGIPTSGPSLTAGRFYNSIHAIDGPLGFGWSSSFHARIHYAAYLLVAPDTYYKEAQVILPDGDHVVFVERPDGSFQPPEGSYDLLVRNPDESFDLTLKRDGMRLHFNAAGDLQTITDEFGNTLEYTNDASGRPQRLSDTGGSGRYLDIYWNANGRISDIQDHSGRVVHYEYDSSGMLASVTNPAGQVTSYSYVPGRFSPVLSRITDYWGRVITDVTWDSVGRVTSYTETGETYSYIYAYQGVAAQTSKTDAAGNRWIFPFGADGLITERRPPSVANTAPSYTTYYPDGNVQLSTDETEVKTFYTYFSEGRVATVTKDYQGPLAVRFDYTYDPDFPDKVTSIVPRNPNTDAYDPSWQAWTYDYYSVGSVAPGALHHAYRIRNDGVTADLMATYAYDQRGRVVSVTDARNAVTDYTYDAAGNLATVTAPANNVAGVRPVTSYTYDSLGRVASVTEPLGAVTTYSYDVLDRILTVALPKPVPGSSLNFTSTYSYDHWDAATSLTSTHVIDPNGVVTQQGYDQFGRLRRSVDGLSNTTQYSYTRDLLTGITDANGNTTSYQYDGIKRVLATVFPDGTREAYAYRADGLFGSRTDRKNQTISYTYDAHKRMTRKNYPNGTAVQYTYTGQQLTQVYDTSVSPTETHTFGYDDAFRTTTNMQATRGTVSYTYLPGDLVGSVTVSGGEAAQYGYYPDGSLRAVEWSGASGGTFGYSYRLNGQYDTITFPNGQTRSHGYDDQGRLVEIANAHPAGGLLARFAYGYDLNHGSGTYSRLGQRVTMTTEVPALGLANAVTQYRYDPAYQLTRADYPAGAPYGGETHAWTYDAIGNRLAETVNGTTTSYAYQKIGSNPNNWQRLTSDGAQAYSYDANGNTLTRGGETYGWDHENRMTSISGTTAATYRYDYQGRRTSKTVGGVTTTYLYDGLNLIAETGASYLYGPGIDEPLAVTRGGAIAYYATDGLGSVVLLADASGAIANSYAYDAWGVPRATSETLPQPLRYTAREVGEVGGQYFYRARYYGAGVGRFLSEDPLRFLASWNLYGYVDASPVMFVDPVGLARHDPNSQYCKNLAQKIANIRADVAKRIKEILDNPLDLPLCKFGAPNRDSVFGHMLIIADLELQLMRRSQEYLNKCGGGPPPAVVAIGAAGAAAASAARGGAGGLMRLPIPFAQPILPVLLPLIHPCRMSPNMAGCDPTKMCEFCPGSA